MAYALEFRSWIRHIDYRQAKPTVALSSVCVDLTRDQVPYSWEDIVRRQAGGQRPVCSSNQLLMRYVGRGCLGEMLLDLVSTKLIVLVSRRGYGGGDGSSSERKLHSGPEGTLNWLC